MKIRAIEIENFKSFSGKHSFEFPKDSGIYMIEGINKVNKFLGSNGSGKTSFFVDSIFFLFFNKTFSGGRPTNIVNVNHKNCSVSAKIEISGKEFLVTRTRRPNGIFIDGKEVDEYDIQNLIGINEEALCYYLFLRGKDNRFFYDLSESEKIKIFSDILDLKIWEECAQCSNVLAKREEENFQELRNEVSYMKGKIEQINERIISVKKSYDSFQDQIDFRIRELEDEIYSITERIKALNRKKKEYIEDAETALSILKEQEKKTEKKRKEYENLREVVGRKFGEAEYLKKYVKEKIKELEDIRSLGTKCPTCGQIIDPQHIEKHKHGIELEKNQKARIMADLYREIKKLKDRRDKTYMEYVAEKREIEQIEEVCNEIARKIENIETEMKALNDDINYRKELIEIEKNRENSFSEELSKLIEEKERTQKAIERNFERQHELKKLISCYKFWFKGFKEIRYMIIEKYRKIFEIEMNNFMNKTGLVGWKCQIDVQRETTSGNIASGFFIRIKNSDGILVKREFLSGGEKQRVRIACGLALSNLIASVFFKLSHNNQIIIDEPTEHLSKEGINDLLSCLFNLSRDYMKQIFLIDHHMIEWSKFNGRILVEKDESGSKLVY